MGPQLLVGAHVGFLRRATIDVFLKFHYRNLFCVYATSILTDTAWELVWEYSVSEIEIQFKEKSIQYPIPGSIFTMSLKPGF
jgi:hypothetical protein